MTLYINPNEPSLKDSVDSLEPTTGYCIFIDIAGSTEMKSDDIKKWIALIHNTFSNIKGFLNPLPPLKIIGDEIMYYIPDEALEKAGHTPLTIFAELTNIAKEEEEPYKDVRIAVAHCKHVYNITFNPGATDYYGKDIDLTARLLTKARSQEIIMNEPFYEQIKSCYDAIGNKEQLLEVNEVKGPWVELFKGFEHYITIYKLPNEKFIQNP